MSLQFTTKAGTLSLLQGRLNSARIAPLVFFTVADWQSNDKLCISQVLSILGEGPWIVRSSSQQEDSAKKSNAGVFLSFQNVMSEGLKRAVEQVIASYGKAQPLDEVLIQPMLSNILRSGVAFSHDPNTCAPYRVINWSELRDTKAVTSGVGGRTWHQAAHSPFPVPTELESVVMLLKELLSLYRNVPIDCEFAITQEVDQEILWLLQARPLVLMLSVESPEVQSKRLKHIHNKLVQEMKSRPFLKGRRTVYGVMPDWNPAEIIGIRPKPLALSLYRELITDTIWAYQRHNYGYRNLRSYPLMPHFFGLPYIDVRLSFNSFIPADLDEGMAGRLVDYYIDCLLAEHLVIVSDR